MVCVQATCAASTRQALSFALYPPRPLDPALHLRGGRAAEAGSGARRRGGAAEPWRGSGA